MTGTPFRLPRDWHGNVLVNHFPKMLANLEHDFMFYEWRFNLRTGQTRERILDDIVNQKIRSSTRGCRATRRAIHGTC